MKKLTKDPKSVDKLYEKYGKLLEGDHWGEYIAISDKGKFILGPNLTKVMKKSLTELGPDSHLYKVGEIAVYRSGIVRMAT